MIRRFYVHNFRCLVNFELNLADFNSVLLVGRNGSGKSAVRDALLALRSLASGRHRLEDALPESDLNRIGDDRVLTLEIETEIESKPICYRASFELQEGNRQFRVTAESLSWKGDWSLFERTGNMIHVGTIALPMETNQLALPILELGSDAAAFKNWLSDILIMAPIPPLIDGESIHETLVPKRSLEDFAEWYRVVSQLNATSSARILEFLSEIWPDIRSMKNVKSGKVSRNLEFLFENGEIGLTIPFDQLSDGEKCFVIASTVQAWAENTPGAVCFWDEPDNYLSLSEVGQLILSLRRTFKNRQFIATSHNPEAIHMFSRENTIVIHRDSHSEPTQPPKLATELPEHEDLVDILASGEESIVNQ